jgi:hypothetical protein
VGGWVEVTAGELQLPMSMSENPRSKTEQGEARSEKGEEDTRIESRVEQRGRRGLRLNQN